MELGALTVYADGRYSRYDEAKVGLLTHGLQYGTGCFEGVRGFWNAADNELYLLQLEEHFVRLANSAKLLMMKLPHDTKTLCEITAEIVARNGFKQDIYIRPVAYKASEDVGVRLHNVKDAFAIIAIPFDRYFDSNVGLKAGVSSWRRIDDTMAPARAKITGVYVNSALAKSEAQLNGFDEAIMLSSDGHVAEGSAENIILVKNGIVYTPDAAQNILEGITRQTILDLAADELGLTVVQRAIDRSELYGADEILFTGSAVGVQWVQSVDHRPVGDATQGPIAAKLVAIYDNLVHGRSPKYASLLTPTYANRNVHATA